MPPFTRGKAVCSNAYLTRHDGFELIVRNFEECKKLSNEDPHIALVDEREAQVECSSSDADVWIA